VLEFLTVLALVALLLLGVVVAVGWLALRRIRRSRLVAAGMQLAADGVLVVSACRPRPTPHRAAALQALRVTRAHRVLRERIAVAERAGAHLGDVPALLPRLEAEGRRLRDGLGRLVGSTAAAADLLAAAEAHLATLADLTEVVDAAGRTPARDEHLARDAEEAALALRLQTAAYTELTAADVPSRVSR
jgi:hypothetical protein